jgi:hypothetical protein
VSTAPEQLLPEPLRRQIFAVLVEVQDQGVNVMASRRIVAAQFRVTEHQVWRIEQEGSDKDWPPL